MAVPKNDMHKDYVRYAEHCLKMVPAAADPEVQQFRAVQREMAAEWLRLADAVRRPSKRQQTQTGRYRPPQSAAKQFLI
jgi:hypothetical protein